VNHETLAKHVVPSANADGTQATPRKRRPPRTGQPAQVWSPAQAQAALSGDLPGRGAHQEPTDVFEREEVDVFNPQTPQERLHALPKVVAEATIPVEKTAQLQNQPTTPQAPTPARAPVVPVRSPADNFLQQSQRMTIEVNDGTFLLPIISAKQSQYGIILFLPMAAESTLFLPKPGTEMVITCRIDGQQQSRRVYYPGTYAEVPELSVIVMSLIVAEDDGKA